MKKGFTLLELLIVIGILAVLAAIVALVLNPAELLRQARDGQRLSDLQSVNRALGIYLATASSPSLGTNCGVAAGKFCTVGTASFGPTTAVCVENQVTTVASAGWVSANFTAVSGGSPLARLPLDPSNTSGATGNHYEYACNNTNLIYEINANMESTKFATGGGADVESAAKDGGDNANVFEIGNAPGLNLI